MKYLRTVSTQRLLTLIAALVVLVGGGAAIAVAAAGNGPVPKRESLPLAIHQALSAKTVTGITARITFTNNLIDSSDIQGETDPLLQGASGRLWMSDTPGDHRLRIELQSDNGDGQVVLENGRFWIYDPVENTAYEGSVPTGSKHDAPAAKSGSDAIPSVAKIQDAINKLAKHIDLSGPIPGDVAGQPTYTVKVAPQHAAGLFGDVQLAWDAVHGVPLRFAIYARGSSSPVLELQATDISYGSVPISDFNVYPPSGTKIVRITSTKIASAERNSARRLHSARKNARQAAVDGVAAVAKRLPFALDAPTRLAGLPRQSVSLLDWSGHPAALVTYGKNLGGIAVIEQSAPSGASAPQSTGEGQGNLSLPTVTINAATGTELDTALGTLIRFTRNQVAYTVIGSVPAAAAAAAARGL